MIGLRIGPPAAGRRGRIGLLLGLVVLIAAHLAGHVHGPAFTGPHAPAGASSSAHPTARDIVPSPEHGPGHEHEHPHADEHVDHAVDRPRAVVRPYAVTAYGPDTSGLSSSLSWLSAADPQRSAVTGMVFEGARGGARAPDGRSALALHCVWRQ
ncbi:hypothetical protein KBZ10_09165 [Streptomyces sp. F63]|uniref:hypothetical protein n=1 Tax=Streptomyces sp. F63 TaxID=2824887 RepID=UPI001B37AD4F|nr:hypothetical protein [Streptomyces sp. F63]MBQ0984682.1 hypothetical protein [Streptomyces sp. F63]